MTSDEADAVADLCEMLRLNSRAKGRGDYWVWKIDQSEEEVGAAREVLTTAGHKVVDLRAREPGQDPPDCEANIDGKRCGIEVTELLDQPTLEASINGSEQHCIWTRQDFCIQVQNLIDRKDRADRVRGGPYERYFLVIVTDELLLYRETVAEFLKGAKFEARLITDAYLGLSYHPELGGKGSCPVFALNMYRRLDSVTLEHK